MLDCGMWPIEVVSLRIEDVDLLNGWLYVSRSKTQAGKRRLPLTDRTKAALFVSIGKRAGGWVFPSPRDPGMPIKAKSLSAAWRKAARKAGVSDDVDLYAARHVFGTDLMTATKNPFLVSRMMGHTDLAITSRYQHHEADGVAALMNQRNRERELCRIPRRSQQMVQ
jgi:integrase